MSELHRQGALKAARAGEDSCGEPGEYVAPHSDEHSAAEVVRARRMARYRPPTRKRADVEKEMLRLQVEKQAVELAQVREALGYLYQQIAPATAAAQPLFSHLGAVDLTALGPAKITAEMMAELASDDE